MFNRKPLRMVEDKQFDLDCSLKYPKDKFDVIYRQYATVYYYWTLKHWMSWLLMLHLILWLIWTRQMIVCTGILFSSDGSFGPGCLFCPLALLVQTLIRLVTVETAEVFPDQRPQTSDHHSGWVTCDWENIDCGWR